MDSKLLAQRRNALFMLFLIVGVSMGTWITRTPAIRDSLGVSISEMGMVLFGLSLGSMSGILSAGYLVRRAGTRGVTLRGLLFIAAGLAVMALGLMTQVAFVVALGLGFVGAGMGTSEIAINIDGAHVESLAGKPVLHALHGFFSLGTAVGALLGMLAAAIGFAVQWHLAAIAVLCVPPILWAIRFIPAGFATATTNEVHTDASGATSLVVGPSVWRDPKLLLIGFIVLAMAFAEGSANDWLPLLMVDGHGFDPASGSMVFLGFALAMTVGRFGGGYFLARYGRIAVMRASAMVAVLGLATVIFSHSQVLAGIAVMLWGVGASLGFPVALSAAGESGPDSATRVRVAATAGYVAFLVGPPLLGFIGQAFGLRGAMLVVMACVVVAGVIASAVGPTKPQKP